MLTLSGYKTYIIAAIVVACALVEGVLGWDIPGFDIGDDWVAVVLGGLGLGSLRASIGK